MKMANQKLKNCSSSKDPTYLLRPNYPDVNKDEVQDHELSARATNSIFEIYEKIQYRIKWTTKRIRMNLFLHQLILISKH